MTAESIAKGLGRHWLGAHPARAALSTSGLRLLDRPRDVCNIIVLAVADRAGEAAAKEVARRWGGEGRRVSVARPPRGMDFNDMLLAISSGDRCRSQAIGCPL